MDQEADQTGQMFGLQKGPKKVIKKEREAA